MPVCLRETVLALAAAVLETVQQPLFFEEGEGAKDGTAVDGGKVPIELVEREGGTKFLDALHNEQAQSRGTHAVPAQ